MPDIRQTIPKNTGPDEEFPRTTPMPRTLADLIPESARLGKPIDPDEDEPEDKQKGT